jgi:hypothetical protein
MKTLMEDMTLHVGSISLDLIVFAFIQWCLSTTPDKKKTLNLKEGCNCEIRKEIRITVACYKVLVIFQNCPEWSGSEIQTQCSPNMK